MLTNWSRRRRETATFVTRQWTTFRPQHVHGHNDELLCDSLQYAGNLHWIPGFAAAGSVPIGV
jgi:hypothetical protein